MDDVRKLTRDGEVLVARIEYARSVWARTRGLLGRVGLAPDEGLWIDPCSSIHTHFMRFTMDAVFLDRSLRVTKVVHSMKPWRISGGGKGAHSVLEFAAGVAKTHDIHVGQQLAID